MLHFGFCCRIKTPKWLGWPWNLSTDYFGFTWFELNVRATRLLRGKELAWIPRWPCRSINNCTHITHPKECFRRVFSFIAASPNPARSCSEQTVSERSKSESIFRPSFIFGLAAITETPASTRIDESYFQDCIHHFNKGNNCNFLIALSFPKINFIE